MDIKIIKITENIIYNKVNHFLLYRQIFQILFFKYRNTLLGEGSYPLPTNRTLHSDFKRHLTFIANNIDVEGSEMTIVSGISSVFTFSVQILLKSTLSSFLGLTK